MMGERSGLAYEVGHGAVFVRLHLAVFTPPYEQYDGADERYEAYKHPPSALSDVMKPADRYAETRQKKREAHDHRCDIHY